MVNLKAMVNIDGQMVQIIKDNFQREKDMDMEYGVTNLDIHMKYNI